MHAVLLRIKLLKSSDSESHASCDSKHQEPDQRHPTDRSRQHPFLLVDLILLASRNRPAVHSAGSRISPASVPAGRSDSAASRNRPAVNSAGATQIMLVGLKSQQRFLLVGDQIKGRHCKNLEVELVRISGKGPSTSKHDFGNVTILRALQNFTCFLYHKFVIKRTKFSSQTLIVWCFPKNSNADASKRVPFSMEKLKKKCMSLSLKDLKILTSQSMYTEWLSSEWTSSALEPGMMIVYFSVTHKTTEDVSIDRLSSSRRFQGYNFGETVADGSFSSQDKFVPRYVLTKYRLGIFSACSRHQVYSMTSHMNAVKKIFKYLKGHQNVGCVLKILLSRLEFTVTVIMLVLMGIGNPLQVDVNFWEEGSLDPELLLDNVNTAASCTLFLLTRLVSAGCSMVLLVVIFPAARLVSAGFIFPAARLVSAGCTMVLFGVVAIVPAGFFVPAGRYGLCCW
ncbi:hypothetical protein Tco_0976539 [Tanacetum coccineum]|uniref:Uncharacterized protein n=1 Tax=Tanacetum coccineum TaxID=301880 RepID=A0ABQ5EIN7_9ASTR